MSGGTTGAKLPNPRASYLSPPPASALPAQPPSTYEPTQGSISLVFGSSLALMPTPDEKTRFWNQYLAASDAELATIVASPGYVRQVWGGVPTALRASVWNRTRGVPPPQFTFDESRLAPSFATEVETALESAPTAPAQCDPVADAELIRTALKIDACVHDRASPPHNAIPLIRSLHRVTRTVSASATLQVYQALSHRLTPWLTDAAVPSASSLTTAPTASTPTAASAARAAATSSSAAGAGAAAGAAGPTLKDTVLAVADIIARSDAPLSAALDRGGVDAHDLATLLREWGSPLFAAHFPPALADRAVDIALLDPLGAAAVAPLLYGVLKLAEAALPQGELTACAASAAAAAAAATSEGPEGFAAAGGAAAASPESTPAGAGAGAAGAGISGNGEKQASFLTHILSLPSRLLSLSPTAAAAAVNAAVAVSYHRVRKTRSSSSASSGGAAPSAADWQGLVASQDWAAALKRSGAAPLTVAPGLGARVPARVETAAEIEARLRGQLASLYALLDRFTRERVESSRERARAQAQAEAEAESRKALRRLAALADTNAPAAKDVIATVERLGAQLAEIEHEVFTGVLAPAPPASAAGAASGAAAGAAGSGAGAGGVGVGAGVSAAEAQAAAIANISEAFAAARALFDRLQLSMGSALVAHPPVSGGGLRVQYDLAPDASVTAATASEGTAAAGDAAAAGAGAAGAGAGAAGAGAAGGTVVFRRTPPRSGVIKFSELWSYLELPCARMEGYLRKARSERVAAAAGDGGPVLVQRYFALQGPFMAHFRSHTDRAPGKDVAVDLRGRTVALIDNHPLGPYAIEVCTRRQGTLYLLFADSELERRKWVLAITAVARLPRS